MTLKNFGFTLCVFAGSMVSAFAQTTSTSSTHTSTVSFAPVGLGSTETLQVNVTNHASNPSTGSPASCAVSVSFLNAAGTAIGSATAVTATAGQTSSAKLTSTQAGTGVHGEVRVSITLTTTSGVACSPSYTIETYDTSSGATHLYQTVNGPVSSFFSLPGR